MNNRREFFAAASSSLALASLGAPSLALARQTATARRVGGSPTLAVFEGLQGHDFEVATGDASGTTLSLVAVKEQDSQPAIEQFTLVLRGSDRQRLGSGIYQLAHSQTGQFQLRLESSGKDEHGPLYRADLSLLL